MFFIICLICLFVISNVDAHGRLIEPPGRSSAWRFGFRTLINYNDNELFCGGFNVQWNLNGGKCGICGDPYNGKRDNELPNGKYAKNVITRIYNESSIIDVKVTLTANHKGYFVFKICPAIRDDIEVTQECLDENTLKIVDNPHPYKYYVPTSKPDTYDIKLQLPENFTCHRCVLQWTYTAGNNWGRCDDGRSYKVGCGPQETFMGCSDIKIVKRNTFQVEFKGTSNAPESTTPNIADNDCESTTKRVIIVTKRPVLKVISHSPLQTINFQNNNNNNINDNICKSYGVWRLVAKMNEWCQTNCAVGFCPASHCLCQ